MPEAGRRLAAARRQEYDRILREGKWKEAVQAYLVQKGVDASRLTAKGYGPDRPAQSNKTAKGREANRQFTNEEIENRQKVWWPILFLALLLLVTESLLAQRIKVAKVVG